MPQKPKMSIDIETRSPVQLKTTGVYPYAVHPETEVMCICYKVNDGPVHRIIPYGTNDTLDHSDFEYAESPGGEFLRLWKLESCTLHAFNETFERIVLGWNKKLNLPKIHFNRFHCTQVRAYYYNLPADLGTCAMALKLQGKDMSGKNTMMQLARRRKPSKDNPDIWFTREKYPEKYEILYDYCDTDVAVEDAISEHLGPIPAMEMDLFNLDKEINGTGLYIDVEALKRAMEVDKLVKAELKQDFNKLTGINPTQRAKYIEYVEETYGYELPNTQAETVKKILKEEDQWDAGFIVELKIYQKAAKTSLSKLKKFLACMTPDQRIHGALQFYGASSSGRWAGRLIQPQNLPSRNVRKDIDDVFKNLMNMTPQNFIEHYREDDVVKTLSSCLRGFIIPPPGHVMFMVDYSAIEGRVISWLGDVETDLTAFREGLCVYREFGKLAYGMTHEEAHALPKGGWQRQALKACILSLGYGVGHEKLGNTLFEDTNEEIDIRCSSKTCHRQVCRTPDKHRALLGKLLSQSQHHQAKK